MAVTVLFKPIAWANCSNARFPNSKAKASATTAGELGQSFDDAMCQMGECSKVATVNATTFAGCKVRATQVNDYGPRLRASALHSARPLAWHTRYQIVTSHC